MAEPRRRTRNANRGRRRVTLDEALSIVARLPITTDLDLREAAAVRAICRHLTSEKSDTSTDCPTRSAAPA